MVIIHLMAMFLNLFAKNLQEIGIIAQYSIPVEPQQNRVVKRRTSTLINMV